MELGMIGMGRMGGNMAQRLLWGGHTVVIYDPNPEAVEALAEHFGVSGEVPFRELPEEFRSALFYGTGGMKIPMTWEREEREICRDHRYEGICLDVERLYRETLER